MSSEVFPTQNVSIEWLRSLNPEQLQELDQLLTVGMPIWIPQPGPQTEALKSQADRLFYGGAAGGGKTDLLIGAGLTAHRRSIIFRRQGVELIDIIERTKEIVGHANGFAAHPYAVFRNPTPSCDRIDFGSCLNLGDEQAYQGRAHDLKAFDEIERFLRPQFEFLCGWNRSQDEAQRCRVIATGNPPLSAEGDWVIAYWAPWLDDTHPNPAQHGELRWFATIAGEDKEVEGGKPFEFEGEMIEPHSRTFIPSNLDDNLYLRDTGYRATLQALPEPLRSKMLHGNFQAGREEDPWQVIPTAWVEAAQERWKSRNKPSTPMVAMGVDPARGGDDDTVLSPRHDNWFDEQMVVSGSDTPDGPSVVALVAMKLRDRAQVNVDGIGIGSSVYDHLVGANIRAKNIIVSEKSVERDRTGSLGFFNKRAELWWRMREALDPDYGDEIALPPDPKLKSDLCAPRWKVTARGIQVEMKEDVIKRIGRSPDRGDAAVNALVEVLPEPEEGRRRRPGGGGWMAS